MVAAYLDIETTGLSRYWDEITVIGVGLAKGSRIRIVQFFGEELARQSLVHALKGASTIYTYNGSRFDLPFIEEYLGVDLTKMFEHHDLMYDCWDRGLYGGFKAVEEQLDIPRRLQGLHGLDAVLLWDKYKRAGDQEALDTLLEYNREDVSNLRALKTKLRIR
jgi:uncharacterized protein YprB with RNaseH-like and TPR domain